MELLPKFVVLHKLKENKKNLVEKGVEIVMFHRKEPMSQHCFNILQMLRHYVRKS